MAPHGRRPLSGPDRPLSWAPEVEYALADGFADSRPFRILAPRMAASEFEPVQWKVATLLKDLDNVLAAAVQAGLELPCAGLAAERLRQQADRAGLAQADLSTIIRLYQQE